MKDYTFEELGAFTQSEIEGLKKELEGTTFMHFRIHSSNIYCNHYLIVSTDYDATEAEIKAFFIHAALSKLSTYQKTR